jgi:hypothetical protein
MKRRRFSGLTAVAASGIVLAVAGGLVFAPGAAAAPAGSITSAVGVCSSKGAAGYGEVAVTGAFTGLTPNTSYQLELDQLTPRASGRTTPVSSSATGDITFPGEIVYTGGLSSFTAGPATFDVLPTESTSGAESITGSVTIADGNCTSLPTELIATPSFASTNPFHLYLFRLSATLTSNGVPVPGKVITFAVPGYVLCNSVTNVRGTAYCQPYIPLSRLKALLANRGVYTATFAGDPDPGGYASSSASAPLIGCRMVVCVS